jgi:hypothetical protein
MEIYKPQWLIEKERESRSRLKELPEAYSLVLKLRDLVEEADLYNKLTTDAWFMLCAAMDAIEDTQQAIEAYLTVAADQKREAGERYLRTYGVLQALVVQQDATSDLCNALSASQLWNLSPLEKIRELRIKSIGHPTLTRKSKSRPQSSHFIVQVSLGNRGFELISFDDKGQMTRQFVSIPDLAATQQEHINKALNALLRHIRRMLPQP